MIYAFTGKTGSGKTFLMIREAYNAWRRGVDIYSNTKLYFDKDGLHNYILAEHPKKFSYWERGLYQLEKIFLRSDQSRAMIMPRRGKIVYFTNINEILDISNGIILFDEAQVLFNARNWEALPYDFQYKLQQSRKHNLSLYCTTQNLGTIDITYRRLVHSWIHCQRNFSLGNIFFGLFTMHFKDIDFLYNNVDDLKVPDLKTKIFLIHYWSKTLYDTFYDIGFHPLKTLCLINYQLSEKKLLMKIVMLPKQMSLSEGLRSKSMINSQLHPNRSMNYRKH